VPLHFTKSLPHALNLLSVPCLQQASPGNNYQHYRFLRSVFTTLPATNYLTAFHRHNSWPLNSAVSDCYWLPPICLVQLASLHRLGMNCLQNAVSMAFLLSYVHSPTISSLSLAYSLLQKHANRSLGCCSIAKDVSFCSTNLPSCHNRQLLHTIGRLTVFRKQSVIT
jgi:hypothetical protein